MLLSFLGFIQISFANHASVVLISRDEFRDCFVEVFQTFLASCCGFVQRVMVYAFIGLCVIHRWFYIQVPDDCFRLYEL
jgi:hypothetical protein